MCVGEAARIHELFSPARAPHAGSKARVCCLWAMSMAALKATSLAVVSGRPHLRRSSPRIQYEFGISPAVLLSLGSLG